MACRVAMCLGMVFWQTGWAEAQGIRGQPPPQVIQFVPLDVEGKVVEVRPGVIAVATAGSGVWRVGVDENAAISVAGTAAPDVLRPGLHIRFLAAVEKPQGRVLDKIAKLTIFTPTKDDARTVGVFLPGQCRPVVSFLEEAAAGPPANVAGGAAENAAGAMAATAPKPAAHAPPPSASKEQNAAEGGPAAAKDTYDIHAQITGGKGSRWTIKTPNKFFKSPLRIELAPQPLIELDLVNYLMAKPGDKVLARGCRLGPNNLQATELLITLTEPLGQARKKPPKLTARPPAGIPLAGARTLLSEAP
jgi:hypothetical protein